jgi:2-aminoadipate transaminase
MSTFSKTVAPGLRVAWLAGPAPIVARMEIAKQSTDLCTGSLDQRLVCEIFRRGVLDRRLPALRECYKTKRLAMETALARELGELVRWTTPKGGFFVWASFLRGINTDALLARALAHGVLYVPGSAFYVDEHGGADARFAFSAASLERIDAGITRLSAAVREEIAARGLTASEGRPSVDRSPSDRPREPARTPSRG